MNKSKRCTICPITRREECKKFVATMVKLHEQGAQLGYKVHIQYKRVGESWTKNQ